MLSAFGMKQLPIVFLSLGPLNTNICITGFQSQPSQEQVYPAINNEFTKELFCDFSSHFFSEQQTSLIFYIVERRRICQERKVNRTKQMKI